MKIFKPFTHSAVKAFSRSAKNGRRNVPRYLYHVTSKKNYEGMLKKGVIKAGQDAALESNLNGVFMFDLKNFTKRWCHMGFDIGENPGENFLTLAKALFMKNSSKTSDIVVLRIPTKGLPLDKLKCRIQGGVNPSDISMSHVMNGDIATKQAYFTRKKHPIEYIFQGNIPMSGVQKAGEANTGVILEEMIDASTYNKLKPLEILKNLFRGQPEEKCVQIANNSSIKLKNLFG